MITVRLQTLLFRVIPVLLLAIMLLLVDIAINKPDTAKAVSDMLPAIPPDTATGPAVKAEDVLNFYQAFDAPVVESIQQPELQQANIGLTPEQQDQQHGLLRELYINDDIYRLSAIINQGRYIASLSVTDVTKTDAPLRRLQLKAGDTLAQYEVVSVTARRITLRYQQRELWLQLFTPEQTQPVAN